MNTASTTGNRGASITPSARESIHCHGTYCPFWHSETMGRYGLGSSMDQQQHACASQRGTDEVDNVMSKLAHSSSPIPVRRIEIHRRNSLNSPKQTVTDDEDSNILSTSSPAVLSPNSYCSYDSDNGAVLNSNDSSVTSTNNSSLHQRRLNNSRGNRSQSSSPLTQHSNLRYEDESTKQKNTKSNVNITLLLISLVVIVSIFIYRSSGVFKTDIKTSNIYDKLNFYNDVKDVGRKYKVSDDSILQVRAGVSTIFEKQDTGSFIFAYNSDVNNFSPVNFNHFMNELASSAARYLRNHTKIVHHVTIDSGHLHVKTDKELMDEYLDDVDKTGVMLVKDLDKIPSNIAMAFHYYCDEYNPLVKRSAIFFTLNMARCPNARGQKYTHEKIEKCLADKWDKVPQENIQPLLTRVVSVVIDVTSEF